MNKYILRSEYDCLVKSQGEESLLDSNCQIIFDSPQQLLIYPLTQSKFSYPFVLDLSKSEDGKNFRVLQYGEKRLFFLHSPYYIKNEIIEEVSCCGKRCEVGLSQEEISFKGSNSRKTLPVLSEFKTYSVQVKSPFIILILSGKDDEIVVYNAKNDSISTIKGKKIEVIDNKIFVTKSAHDISAHQIYETYEIKDKIEKINTKFKLELQSKPLKGNIVALAFVQCLKVEDYDLALSYLSEELRQSTTIDHLKKYFGEIITYNHLEDSVIAITNKNQTRIFSFEVKNDKICEIEILH